MNLKHNYYVEWKFYKWLFFKINIFYFKICNSTKFIYAVWLNSEGIYSYIQSVYFSFIVIFTIFSFHYILFRMFIKNFYVFKYIWLQCISKKYHMIIYVIMEWDFCLISVPEDLINLTYTRMTTWSVTIRRDLILK